MTSITREGMAMTYSIRLPREIEDRLEKLSVMTGRSKSFYVKKAILEHLTEIEEIYLAEKRLGDIYAGRTKTIPLKKVMNEAMETNEKQKSIPKVIRRFFHLIARE